MMAPSLTNNSNDYTKLERRLVLLAWFNSLFGYEDNQELLDDIEQAEEGFDAHGRSYVYYRLIGRGRRLQVPESDLVKYDENIHAHLTAINKRRSEPITLRYFQYLTLLYTEIFLDWRFNRTEELLTQLNAFVGKRNEHKAPGDPADTRFSETDLNKLAYWMATGSGKTLIMHINYRQFLHYNRESLDNILLITPNEGLTEQHIEEMTTSDIRSERFNLSESGLGLADQNTVRAIEITKLVEEKRGGGVSVPVDSFEGNNLIFVDEGHKGSGGEVWRKFRDALGQTGFTFEYSATFGQALTATRNDELTAEYGKAIAFDYSYRYFHGDGFGKDFHILNLREERAEEQTEMLLLGNLLSFYEQQRCFTEQVDSLRAYNLEIPLWVFVGSSVNAVYTENRERRSDVLTVARFLHHFLENKRKWAHKSIKKIIEGTTGLVDANGDDVFIGRFEYLRGARVTPESIYQDVLTRVFRAPTGGTLHIADMRGKDGELGLKVSSAEEYFGLIYIGDTSAFKNLITEDDTGIVVEEDAITESLFDTINEPDTSINILIGAKKFIEGWNSWRVSNMGLLNIGRREGSEIIQLFGRGVRLRGRDFSLKRSTAIPGEHPAHIRLLETLNIFAVRANYMAQFRDYLLREGVDVGGFVEMQLPIKPNDDFLGKGLYLPRLSTDQNFATTYRFLLAPDAAARITVDLSLKVESMRSQAEGVATTSMQAGNEQTIPLESLNLIDWDEVYLNLLDFKEKRNFFNLAIPLDVPRALLEARDPRLYKLIADDSVVKPNTFREVTILQEAVIAILRKYTEKYYRICQARWESQNMAYVLLDANDDNFQDYQVRVPKTEDQLIDSVQQLLDEGERIYQEEAVELPNIHFDRHLYQPLLLTDHKITSVPKGLEPSEKQFIEDLRQYVIQEKDEALVDKEVFLLRNLSRGKGVGFFESAGFYPDFILWIKEDTRQRIIFVEPHGMRQEKTYWTSDKTQLHGRLQELSVNWAEKAGITDVELDSFIVSVTPYDELREHYGDGAWSRQDFAEGHILFFDRDEDHDYIAALFADSNHAGVSA